MKEQNTILAYLFLFSWCLLLLGHCARRRERRRKGKLQVTVIYRWLLSPPKNGRANYKVLREQERLEPFTKIIIIIGRIKNVLWQCAGLTIAHPALFVFACTFRTVPRSWSWPCCTLFRSLLFDKNMVNQARQCDQILENGPTHYTRTVKSAIVDRIPGDEVDELSEDSANGVYASSSAVARTEHEKMSIF